MKYLIVLYNGLETPILFPEFVRHIDPMPDDGITAAVAAGMVNISSAGITCFGRSEGLDIESRGEQDAKLIEKLLNTPPL